MLKEYCAPIPEEEESPQEVPQRRGSGPGNTTIVMVQNPPADGTADENGAASSESTLASEPEAGKKSLEAERSRSVDQADRPVSPLSTA